MTLLRPALLAMALAILPAAASGQTAAEPAGPAEGPQPSQPPVPAAPAEGAAGPDAAPGGSAPSDGPSDDSVRMLEELSPFIADLQIVGPWTDGERTGIWRTVTLQPQGEGTGNRFFVQQIEEVDGAPAVSSSTEITEVGDLNGALIGYRADPPSEAQPELLTLFMDIVPLDGEIAETYELFFAVGEPYTFGPASN